MLSPFARQLLVGVSPQLAALSVGGAVTFPSVVLQQGAGAQPDTPLDINTASWIGSIHGLAGIPSVLMPALMQWRGRKFAFISACALSAAGWLLAYCAHSAALLLLSESLHGLGNNSLLAVSLLSISEMVNPKFRNVSMVSFHVVQTFGMALMSIIGRYMHWRTVSVVMFCPVAAALVLALAWPESPAWLAWRGQFAECERAFTWLRGSDQRARTELQELITAQKEQNTMEKINKQKSIWSFFHTLRRRDFYLPCIHMTVLLTLTYWSGSLPILIYAIQMIEKATQDENAAFFGGIIMNCILFVCVTASTFLIRRFKNKTVLVASSACAAVCLMCGAGVSYLQVRGSMSGESRCLVYILALYMGASSCGVLPVVFTVAAELMPVQHRGAGGALYVVLICALHASSLKAAPYLLARAGLGGALLLYATVAALGALLVALHVPETKGRTLQQIELFYSTGSFHKRKSIVLDTEMFVFENESYEHVNKL